MNISERIRIVEEIYQTTFVNNSFVTKDKIDVLVCKADEYGISIDPKTMIITTSKLDSLKITETPAMARKWNTEVFKDPLLRKYRLVEVIPDLLFRLQYNTYSAFDYAEIRDLPLERYNVNNINYLLYQDNHRFVAGYSSPFRIIDFDLTYLERQSILAKRKYCIDKSANPNYYLNHPDKSDKAKWELFFQRNPQYRNSNINKQAYIINLIGQGLRLVRTKIEQWVWEEHIIRYYHAKYRQFLNEIVCNDDGLWCQIYVPIGNEYIIREFIDRIYYYHKDELSHIIPDDRFKLSLDYDTYFPEYMRKEIILR